VAPDFRSLTPLIEELRTWRASSPHDEVALAAVATILRAGTSSPEVLFIERAMREGDPWSGDVAFPGGKREKSDDSLQATAMRETLEEIGLKLDPESFVVRLEDVFGRVNGYRVAQFVFVVNEEHALTLNAEAVSAFWIPMTTLVAPELVENVTIERGGVAFEVPCIRLGEKILWGMTFRMTRALAEAMRFGAVQSPRSKR
jgi:8-oxo-dGTP pyrophosphatase MutT (NUDIX family)